MEQKKLILGVINHPLFGFILVPYIVVIKPNHGFLQVEAKISRLNTEKYFSDFTPLQKKLVSIIDEYSDKELHKVFSKKKGQTTIDFINGLTKEFADKNIRPYIERRLVKCTDLIQQLDIRVFFKEKPKYVNSDDEINVIKGKTKSVFNISKLESETQYYLTIKHDNKELSLLEKSAFILTENPCRIIINNELYIFNDINAKKLLPFFNKDCIHIPKSSERKWFETFALESIRQYDVRPKGFTIDTSIHNKKAELCFELNLQNEPTFTLSFFYNEKFKFYFNNNIDSSVQLKVEDDNYIFYKLNRVSTWENKILSALEKIGLTNYQGSYFCPKELQGTEDYHYEIIEWFSKHKSKIKDSGIDFIQNFKDLEYCFDTAIIQSEVKEDIDWFDLYIDVKIGEFKIPFIKFKKHILTQNREYKLPNGSIFILPLEWFNQYSELFQFGYNADKHLRLNKHHFGILESTPGKNKSIIEKYKNLINSKFNGNSKVPDGLKADLRPYQMEGYQWMNFLQEHGFGGCLADDMGLGKTIQTLTLLLSFKGKIVKNNTNEKTLPKLSQLSIFDSVEIKNEDTPATSIIIMPTSLIHNWEKEIAKFTPGLKCYKYTGQNRPKDFNVLKESDIILTTYGVVRNDIDFLSKYTFFCIVLDESQYIKNPDSKIYKAVNLLKSKNRFVLTGTPVENSLTDLWAQINFLNKGLLGNLQFFKREFVQPIEKGTQPEKKEKLQQYIQPFVLRRTKHQVAKDLPDKFETVIYCDMTDEQKAFYENEKSKIRNSIITTIDNKEDKPTMLAIEGLNKLRQISNHPVLVNPGYEAESGKFEEITRNIENLIAEKHKVLLFSAYVKHLNLIASYLESKGHHFSMLTGSSTKREDIINDFQGSEDNHVFLIQIKAGGVGLNLTSADYVFIIDPWWNPAVEEQAINRTHRIGQDKKVIVYRFISTDTVEEKIQLLKAKKSKLADSFINIENTSQKISLDRIMEFLA